MDAPLPGTLVAGYPGQAEGNLAHTPHSRCQGCWGPHQVWRALESQQELMVAPVGLEGGLDSLKDKDKVMSRRNWRLSGTGEAWVLPGHGYQFPHSIQSYPEVEGTPQRRPVSPSGRQLLEGEWRWKGQGEVEAGEGRVWGGLRGLSPPCISSHQFSVPRHSGHGGLLLLLVGGFHH